MPRLPALHRHTVALALALLVLSFTACGQVGGLFLRMPAVTFAPQAPFEVGEPEPIFLPAGVTLPAPVSATLAAPAAATLPPTAAATPP